MQLFNNNKMPFGMQMAQVAFQRSKHNKPVGAALVKGGKIILASNSYNESNITKKYDEILGHKCGLHAEAALFGRTPAGEYDGAKVFVYRERKDGTLAMARPCAGCEIILNLHGIKKIYFTTPDGWEMEKL